MQSWREQLGMRLPIVQAPMAGTSTPALAAAVSNAGGLGSVAVGSLGVADARAHIRAVRSATSRPFNVNVFCNRPAQRDAQREARWLERLTPLFAEFGARPPPVIDEAYTSFVENEAMLSVLLEERPAVVSFHFGLPPAAACDALRACGCLLFGTATSLAEAEQLERAGIACVVAQGYEAGGHRGVMDVDAADARLSTHTLTRLLVARGGLPVISAGGVMDGAGIAACLTLGASAVQLGTAFIGCPESSADAAHRAALFSGAAEHTVMTRIVSGRRARCLANRFTELLALIDERDAPDYPVAYAAAKALGAAARAQGESGFAPQWAGQGAPLARALPAAELLAALENELQAALHADLRASCPAVPRAI